MEMTINNYSLNRMVNVLEKDFGYVGIQEVTVLLARHKILNAISLIPQPKLTGIIQIDETFFRESQKAAKKLENYIPSVAEYRKPRYGVQPSLLGIMGSEFANVPVAVDSTGHVVAKVACLGKLSIQVFIELFHDHIDNPAYICTDANPIYKRYC
ncbi:MAG: DNA-binding protein, partial [Clostridia bacterium]|nr:DNA-binding protein [Clostridia bacterium]